ncbi:hypothetical protein NKR23_g12106 [Pleurostoma richardsiae]|uniref:Uncharacterized protein n=1 Tax=Pleurostoma richardsiae TaxID=41990 RepID=A0AA38VD27_9PEZI|nr:hypothetical protein NKR23_g12106 [Pleurostoma richardsiae]
MPIRNPFTRRAGASSPHDENLRPGSTDASMKAPDFERVDTVGSKASSALSVGSSRSHDTGEYKMSVVNDSGVYLPPSPTEDKATWPRRYLSRTSTDTRSSTGDIEPFSISRESFDSYRRSFDISARSPIVIHDALPPRQSLDSARFPRHPRSALAERRFGREPPTAEEGFEDVGLNDEAKQHPQQPKKRGFFSKFSDGVHQEAGPGNATPVSRFLIPGRKRGQSGQGAELGSIEPRTVGPTDPSED